MQPWLHTRQDSNAGNSHAIIDYWRGNARRCLAWCYCGGTARCCVTWCFGRGTARRRGITREGPRDVAWRGVTAEGPRDAVVLMERDCTESGSWQPLVDYLSTILPAAQNFLATFWPLVKILQSLVPDSTDSVLARLLSDNWASCWFSAVDIVYHVSYLLSLWTFSLLCSSGANFDGCW